VSEKTAVTFKKPSAAETTLKRQPSLVVLEGSSIGETFQLAKASTVIGRGDKVDIFLSEEGVSRQHARIDAHGEAYALSDLKSTNGTFVNGTQVQQVVLREGDKIRMGDVVLRFTFQDVVDIDYQEKLRNMAMRDALTKVFNRRYFMDALTREVSFSLRKRSPLSVAILDVDHFKKLNDTHGHPAGDAALRALGQKLASEVRGYDIVARYGGEEFVILLRSTPLENALIFAERIRKAVEEMAVEHEGKTLKFTISLGVATLDPDHAITAEDLLRQADRFLYAAKEGGRNRVASARSGG
jgi:diguanylate cyclase (GGDEF)-like protein